MGVRPASEVIIKKVEAWAEVFIRNLPNLALAIFICCLFYFGARIARKIIEPLLRRISGNLAVARLISSLVSIVIILVGFFTALGILKLDKAVTSLLAGAGVIGLALGFAFQDIASNFISGVFIAFQKPYRVTDILSVNNYEGEVTQVNLRTTHIMTFSGLELIVPNKDMFTQTLINFTSTPFRRLELALGIGYTEDLERVSELLKTELDALPFRIRERPINIVFLRFGASAIELEVQVWIEYPGDHNSMIVRNEMIFRIKRLFEREKISIPYPIRTMDFGIKGGVALSDMLIAGRPDQ